MKRVCLLLFFVLTTITLWAQSERFETDGIWCETITDLGSNAVQVTAPNAGFLYAGDIRVPDEIYIGRTPYKVKRIAAGAFSKSEISSIELPTTLVEIGDNAFSGCSSLKSIDLPEGLSTLGASAFYGCKAIETATIPSTLTTIGMAPFYGCTGTAVIKCNMADNCNLVEYSKFTRIDIAESVTFIGNTALRNCSELITVNFPTTLQHIGANLFNKSPKVTDLTIPESVTEIGAGALSNAAGKLTINCPVPNCPANSASPFNGAFTSVTFGPGVTSIGNYAFLNCRSIKTVVLSEGITSIGASAFSGCTGITRIHLPESVTTIGVSAFSGCQALTDIHLPEGVTTIPTSCFYECSALTSIRIPARVTTLASRVFSGCTGLTDVYATSTTAPTMQSSTFDSATYTSARLHVPTGSLPCYQSSTYWKKFTSIVEESLTTAEIPGDFDGDGTANLNDLDVLVRMLSNAMGEANLKYDLNGDGKVSIGDVTKFIDMIE